MSISPVDRAAAHALNNVKTFPLNNVIRMDDADRIYQEKIDNVNATYKAYQSADGAYTEGMNGSLGNADDAEAALADAKLKFAKASISLLGFLKDNLTYAWSVSSDLASGAYAYIKKEVSKLIY